MIANCDSGSVIATLRPNFIGHTASMVDGNRSDILAPEALVSRFLSPVFASKYGRFLLVNQTIGSRISDIYSTAYVLPLTDKELQ